MVVMVARNEGCIACAFQSARLPSSFDCAVVLNVVQVWVVGVVAVVAADVTVVAVVAVVAAVAVLIFGPACVWGQQLLGNA